MQVCRKNLTKKRVISRKIMAWQIRNQQTPAYLYPNRDSLQEPIGGLSENDRGEGSLLALKHAKTMLKTGRYPKL
jgi:hypothetical protein